MHIFTFILNTEQKVYVLKYISTSEEFGNRSSLKTMLFILNLNKNAYTIQF